MRNLATTFIVICSLTVLTSCGVLPVPMTPQPTSPVADTPVQTPPGTGPELPASGVPGSVSNSTLQIGDIPEDIPQSSVLVTRRYVWTYDGREWSLDLQIPVALYDYYRELPRPPTVNYSVYITHPLDDDYITSLVEEMERMAEQQRFSMIERVEFIAAFVQHLPYTVDSVTTPYDEYPRYPVETLVDNGGDCEDTSIMLATLLDTMGYEVVLIEFPGRHAAVGVYGGEGTYGAYFEDAGKKYFYVETTNTGWGVGKIPEEYETSAASLYGMTPTPILTHVTQGTFSEYLDRTGTISEYIAELEVTVENLGTASADDVYILAGFDAGEGKVWNPQESDHFDLQVNQKGTVTLTLNAPLGKHTRLVIQVIDDGYVVNESYSQWFDT